MTKGYGMTSICLVKHLNLRLEIFSVLFVKKKCFMEYMKNANEMMVYDFSYLLLVSLDL